MSTPQGVQALTTTEWCQTQSQNPGTFLDGKVPACSSKATRHEDGVNNKQYEDAPHA